MKKTSARIDSRDIVKERSLENKKNRLAEHMYPTVEETDTQVRKIKFIADADIAADARYRECENNKRMRGIYRDSK